MMGWRKIVWLVAVVGLSGGAGAAEPDAVVPLWPGDGLPPGVKVQDPQNQPPDAQGLIRRMDKPELRVFLPPADRATGTAVIICPGGGYGLLDYKAHVAEFIADYQRQGVTVIALLYKVPTTAELALTEGKRAIRVVRSRAGQWKIDPQKIGMQGYSAGGHLLVNLLAHSDDGDPQAKDPVDRLSCRPNFVALMCPWNIWKVEKYLFKPPLPPVFLACADDDKVSIDFSDPLAKRLKDLQAPVLYWRVHGGGHSAFHRPSAWGTWMEKLLPWLREKGLALRPDAGGAQAASNPAAGTTPPGAVAFEVVPSQNCRTLAPYEIFDLTFRHDRRYDNPFFDVSIDVTFVSPGGRKVGVGGFHYGSLEKPKIEVTEQTGGHSGPRKSVRYVFGRQNIWKARFAPGEPGRWTYAYVFANNRGEKAAGSGSFDCVTDPGRHNAGFVRQHAANPHRWVFDDGSPYFPIGLQDGVFDGQGVGSVLASWAIDGGFRPDRQGRPAPPPGDEFKIAPAKHVTGDEYFEIYGKAGFNLLRFSQQNFSLPLYRDLDHYLVQEGVMVDELLACARRHGFRVFYGLFGYQPVFAEHPDNAEGMAKVKRFIKYSVDRWGSQVDFWEFLNEQKADARWYEIVSPYLRSIDPYGHPIATSWERPELPGIEVNAPHWYAGIRDELGCDRQTAANAQQWKRFKKPVIVGEHGNSASKEELKTPGVGGVWDIRSATRMRIRNWTALFNEIALVFWSTSYAKDGHYMNIYLGPEERKYVRVMQDFANRLDKDVRMAPVTVSDPKTVRAYGLTSETRAAAYLHHFASHSTTVEDLRVTLDVPRAGKVTWYNPEDGKVLRQSEAPAGRQTLEVPPFEIDIAILILPAK